LSTAVVLTRTIHTPARERPGQTTHLDVRQLQGQGVGDPVDRLAGPPCDGPKALSIVVQFVRAPPHADLRGRSVEQRRALPGGALDAVVLPLDRVLDDDDPVGLMGLVGPVADGVDARHRIIRRRPRIPPAERQRLREVEREPELALGLHRSDEVLAQAPVQVQPEVRVVGRRELGAASGALLPLRLGPAGGRRLGGHLAPALLRRRLRVQERMDGAGDRLRGGRDVGLGGVVDEVRRELDLADGVAGGRHGELRDADEALRRPEALVGFGRLPDDLDERVVVVDQAARADLVLRVAQEVLLPRGAHDVVVQVAEADVVERPLPAELLVPGLDVDLGVLPRRRQPDVGVEVAAVDVGVDAADEVHDAPEAPERDADGVVDLEDLVRHAAGPPAQQVPDRLQRQREPTQRVRAVDLLGALPRDLGDEVARDRHDGRRLLVGIEPHEHHRVRARVALPGAEALVGSDEEDRLRLAGLGRREDLLRDVHGVARRHEVVRDVLDLQQRRRRDRPRRQAADQHTGDGEALVERRPRVRQPPVVRLAVERVVQARPPSTARRSGPEAGSMRSSQLGRAWTKSTSACR
jgi:hypothetical protein